MKIMKYNRLLASVLSMFCLASCADFLTEAPTVALSEGVVYSTEAILEADIVGCYASQNYHNGAWQQNMFELVQPASGLYGWKGDRTSEDWTQHYRLTLNPNNARNADQYDFFYRSVYQCNKLIENLPDSPVNQTFKNEIEGEAKLLRALDYFSLVRFYGDVPLILNTPKGIEDVDVPRTSYLRVYEQVLSDLDYAEQNMRSPERQAEATGTTGRPHKWAATAMKAMVYTQIACLIENQDWQFFDASKEGRAPDFSFAGINTAADAWELALKTAESVINSGVYELAPDYAQLFDWGAGKPVYQLKERILVLQSSNNPATNTRVARYTLPQYPEGTKSASSHSNWGRARPGRYVPVTWCRVHGGKKYTHSTLDNSKLEGLFSSGYDPRFALTYYYYSYKKSTSGTNYLYPHKDAWKNSKKDWNQPFFKKYRDSDFDNTLGYADMYLIRFAEMYLIAAEAAASLSSGPGHAMWQKALDYMEVIHARARQSGAKHATSPSMSNWKNLNTPEDLVNAIMWERVFEHHGEGCYEFFDTHRRGAKWMSEWLAKPINEFHKEKAQTYTTDNKPEYSYFTYMLKDNFYPEDPVELRKSVICQFPEKEFRNNGGIDRSQQNDFYWAD